jgi:2-succinyl-6-hydroxy-2,4-cyclohexadiene-1-carboxylate synthase
MFRAVPEVVALHGFAGSGRSWDAVAAALGEDWTLHAPELPPSLDALPPRFALAGYSMGGRVALHVALAARERVERLVLVSATAGIEDAAEREARRAADEELAARIEQGTIDDFVELWTSQPLFAGDPPEAVARWKAELRRHEPRELAASLRTFGAGVLPPVWDRLGELTVPATVVVGERDEKYRAIAERLVSALPAAAPPIVVPGAGHGLLREAPEAVARAIAAGLSR